MSVPDNFVRDQDNLPIEIDQMLDIRLAALSSQSYVKIEERQLPVRAVHFFIGEDGMMLVKLDVFGPRLANVVHVQAIVTAVVEEP
jgi:hypothetical protein